MTPLERLVERATRLPEVLVEMILNEVYRARIRRQEAARTIQAAKLRPAFVRSRAARALVSNQPTPELLYLNQIQPGYTRTPRGTEQLKDWFVRIPRRYQDRWHDDNTGVWRSSDYWRSFFRFHPSI